MKTLSKGKDTEGYACHAQVNIMFPGFKAFWNQLGTSSEEWWRPAAHVAMARGHTMSDWCLTYEDELREVVTVETPGLITRLLQWSCCRRKHEELTIAFDMLVGLLESLVSTEEIRSLDIPTLIKDYGQECWSRT